MDNDNAPPAKLLVLIALLQGLLLLLLHQALDFRYWPAGEPPWILACYAVALVWPTMLLLGLDRHNTVALLNYTAPYVLLCALLGYYTGIQVAPGDSLALGGLGAAFAASLALASYKALLYAQQLAGEGRLTHAALLRWSWRNCFTLGLALLFTGGVGLVLLLWGALFEAIGINYFSELFDELWFIYPALSLAFGFGIVISRNHRAVIDTATHLLQALMKVLLVLLAALSLLFLAALPFTGLQPLWDSGGSPLILWMQALLLFFFNAVYPGKGDKLAYNAPLHALVSIAIALLPVFSAIVFYGLYLRIGQYGWSLDRAWGAIAWLLLALFPLGYWGCMLKYRGHWSSYRGGVNIAGGLLLMLVMLAVNSPLLDLRKLVVHNQLQRLQEGLVSPEELDLHYFRYQLARPGHDALQDRQAAWAGTHPQLAAEIAALYAPEPPTTPLDRGSFFHAVRMLSTEPPPDALFATLLEDSRKRRSAPLAYYLKALQLDGAGAPEYLWVERQRELTVISIYQLQGERWSAFHLRTLGAADPLNSALLDALDANEVSAEVPLYRDIVIGGERFSPPLPAAQRDLPDGD